MIQASCHCGNVTITVKQLPDSITGCNCSICHRLGALWGYYAPTDIKVQVTEQQTIPYSWGDSLIEFHHCGGCGNTTHFKSVSHSENPRAGVNMRMLTPQMIASIVVKQFDGAVSGRYIGNDDNNE